MGTLFEIVDEFKQLYDMACEEADSEIFADTLEALTGELDAKASGYVNVIQQLEMEEQKAKELKNKYAAIEKFRKIAVERVKGRLLMAMDAIGKDQIPAGDFTIKIQGNGGQQPLWIDEELVPDSFRKVVLEIDKDKIRKALEGGATLSFAELEPRGKHIVIK